MQRVLMGIIEAIMLMLLGAGLMYLALWVNGTDLPLWGRTFLMFTWFMIACGMVVDFLKER